MGYNRELRYQGLRLLGSHRERLAMAMQTEQCTRGSKRSDQMAFLWSLTYEMKLLWKNWDWPGPVRVRRVRRVPLDRRPPMCGRWMP